MPEIVGSVLAHANAQYTAARRQSLQEEFSLTSVQVGQLQSAILMGYVFGQVGPSLLLLQAPANYDLVVIQHVKAGLCVEERDLPSLHMSPDTLS